MFHLRSCTHNSNNKEICGHDNWDSIGGDVDVYIWRCKLVRTISYTRGTSKMVKQQSQSQNRAGRRVTVNKGKILAVWGSMSWSDPIGTLQTFVGLVEVIRLYNRDVRV